MRSWSQGKFYEYIHVHHFEAMLCIQIAPENSKLRELCSKAVKGKVRVCCDCSDRVNVVCRIEMSRERREETGTAD